MPAFKHWRLGLGQDFQIAFGAKSIAGLKDYSFPFHVIEKAKSPSLPARCISQIPIVFEHIYAYRDSYYIFDVHPIFGGLVGFPV